MGGALSGLLIGGLCLLYVMRNDPAEVQGDSREGDSMLGQHAPGYTGQQLAFARQALADGLRKLYESNHDGGFTCYESIPDGGLTCMKPA